MRVTNVDMGCFTGGPFRFTDMELCEALHREGGPLYQQEEPPLASISGGTNGMGLAQFASRHSLITEWGDD